MTDIFCSFIAAIVLACALRVGAEPAGYGTSVKIASDEWCPYICTDEKQIVGGYLVDLAALIFNNRGQRLESVLLPLNRAIYMSSRGVIDGIYAPGKDERLRMSVPFAYSRACFYTTSDTSWRYIGPASLTGQKIAAIDNYGYDNAAFDDYIAQSRQENSSQVVFIFGTQPGLSLVKMLLKKRFKVAIEHEMVMNHLLSLPEVAAADKIRNAGCLENRLPLVIGISKDNPERDKLLSTLNQGLDELHKNGELQKLQDKYHIAP